MQALLLCGVSAFNAYVWEKQVSVLGLESFYFDKKQDQKSLDAVEVKTHKTYLTDLLD